MELVVAKQPQPINHFFVLFFTLGQIWNGY